MVFLFGTMCSLRERDAHCVRDASFGRDVRLRRVSWNTSHHCDHREQHRCAERHNITAVKPLLHLTKARRSSFSGTARWDMFAQICGRRKQFSATNNANRFRYRRKKSSNHNGYWIFLSQFFK